jgi:DNA-binding transcriptional ArsR family regulator
MEAGVDAPAFLCILYNHMVIKRTPPLDPVFHALADPTRRRILESLAHRDEPVMSLAGRFAMSQPAVTKHLNVLERAGLIVRRKDGRQRWCCLQPNRLQESRDWIDRCRNFWNERLDALEELLAETQPEEAPRHDKRR